MSATSVALKSAAIVGTAVAGVAYADKIGEGLGTLAEGMNWDGAAESVRNFFDGVAEKGEDIGQYIADKTMADEYGVNTKLRAAVVTAAAGGLLAGGVSMLTGGPSEPQRQPDLPNAVEDIGKIIT